MVDWFIDEMLNGSTFQFQRIFFVVVKENVKLIKSGKKTKNSEANIILILLGKKPTTTKKKTRNIYL